MLNDQLRLRAVGRHPPPAAVADRRRARRPLAVHQRQQHAAHRPHRPDAVRDRGDPRDPELGRQPRVAVHDRRTPSTSSRRRASACRCPTRDVSIDDYKEAFKRHADVRHGGQRHREDGDRVPDPACPASTTTSAHAGKGPSHGWVFFTSYNTEQGNTQARGERVAERQGLHRRGQLEAGRSSAWPRARRRPMPARYAHNRRWATTASRGPSGEDERQDARPGDCPGLVYYPPDAQVAARRGRRSDRRIHRRRRQARRRVIPVHSFTKMQKAIADKAFDGEVDGHPGAQVRGHHRRRSAEARPRPAAHRVRRQGQRLHLDVHLAPRS